MKLKHVMISCSLAVLILVTALIVGVEDPVYRLSIVLVAWLLSSLPIAVAAGRAIHGMSILGDDNNDY